MLAAYGMELPTGRYCRVVITEGVSYLATTPSLITPAVDRWGTVPQWLSAIGGTASTTFALYIILRDKKKEERKQAELITVRMDWPLIGFGQTMGMKPDRILVHNASSLPVFDLSVRLRALSADDALAYTVFRSAEGDLLADQTCEIDWGSDRPHPIAIRFTDSAGVHWGRAINSARLEPWGKRSKLYANSRDSYLERWDSELLSEHHSRWYRRTWLRSVQSWRRLH